MSITRKMSRFTNYGFVVLVLVLSLVWETCNGSGTFGFDIHHRFSDPVKAMMINLNDELPEVGTVEYYTMMVQRDRYFHGRRLAGDKPGESLAPLTFVDGNTTTRFDSLGYLYYANVSIGTPESWYLVALDTGSHLFWLPCDCAPNCLQSLQFSSTEVLELNIYSLKTSSTGKQLSCNSPFCQDRMSCSMSEIHCPYEVGYLSANTTSSGYLVEDVLHLTTDANSSTPTQATITFGCGVVQTGAFLESAAPNGLLGLTMDGISLPSILASQNLVPNSFSMCFSRGGLGRINFGDKGSKDQLETPLNPDRLNLYNITITRVTMGNDVSAADIPVIFDSGSSFTHLSDPAYTLLTEKFDSHTKDKRQEELPVDIPFEFCYETTSSSPNDFMVPSINLTMNGGDIFSVIHPAIMVGYGGGRLIYCLAIVKSDELDSQDMDINIIGENFMSGYRVVFDHEKNVMGWKASDCDEALSLIPWRDRPRTNNPYRSGAPSALEHNCFIIAILILQSIVLHLILL